MRSPGSISIALVWIAALFFQVFPLNAETISLALGERTVVLDVPSGCLLSDSGQEIYDCRFATTRNKFGGSYAETSEVFVAAQQVDPGAITKHGKKFPMHSSQNPDIVSGVSLAEASQNYILATDHSVFRSLGGVYKHLSLVGQLDEGNSMAVSRKQPWGGSDCRIFASAAGLTMSTSNVLGVERGGMRCILWSYSKGNQTGRALDVIVEVREWDDFRPNGSKRFTSFWQPIVQSVRFE